MSITLQGTTTFEPEFVGQLSQLGRALLDAGFDPSSVVIVKQRSRTSDGAAPLFNYIVQNRGAQFTIAPASDDALFLDRLLTRIHDDAHANAALAASSPACWRASRAGITQ
ncbi:MAG: hypothetical protein MZV49_02200 [Rhodopseudomonas palustris]|nr:hypothetical protein [Rhodopseudomonas palustris]